MAESPASPKTCAPVPSLICLGRSPDADLTYRHLVRSGPATARAIAADLGMERPRVVTALDELATVHAVRARTAPHRAATWHAMPPADVEAALRRPARTGAPHDGAPDASAYQAAGISIELGDELRCLPSRAATRARLAELVAVAGHEHLGMHPEAVFDPASLQAAAPMDRELLRRGVRMRVLGVQPEDEEYRAHRTAAPTSVPAYRLAAGLPGKLLIIDRKVALFPVAPDDLDRGYLEATQAPVVAALVALFERYWDRADLPKECPMPQIVLDPRERALIALLAQGHTDATAARALRVSPRSVSAMLRSLMDRLHVDNRFQLGLALGAAHAVVAPAAPTTSSEEQS